MFLYFFFIIINSCAFIYTDALYKWLTKNSAGSGFGVSGGFGGSLANDPQFYSDYDAGYTFSEPAFVDTVDTGSSYVPAEPATPAWRKRK